MIDQMQLIASANRALLFNILPSIRMIYVKVKNRGITLNIVSEEDLNDFERDIYFAVLGEISGDFESIDISQSETNFITSTLEFSMQKIDGIMVYARFEN